MTTSEFRVKLGAMTESGKSLSRSEFSRFFGIPYSTVLSWDQRDNMPIWLYGIFKHYVLPSFCLDVREELRKRLVE